MEIYDVVCRLEELRESVKTKEPDEVIKEINALLWDIEENDME